MTTLADQIAAVKAAVAHIPTIHVVDTLPPEDEVHVYLRVTDEPDAEGCTLPRVQVRFVTPQQCGYPDCLLPGEEWEEPEGGRAALPPFDVAMKWAQRAEGRRQCPETLWSEAMGDNEPVEASKESEGPPLDRSLTWAPGWRKGTPAMGMAAIRAADHCTLVCGALNEDDLSSPDREIPLWAVEIKRATGPEEVDAWHVHGLAARTLREAIIEADRRWPVGNPNVSNQEGEK